MPRTTHCKDHYWTYVLVVGKKEEEQDKYQEQKTACLAAVAAAAVGCVSLAKAPDCQHQRALEEPTVVYCLNKDRIASWAISMAVLSFFSNN